MPNFALAAKNKNQRADVEHQLEDGVELFFRRHVFPDYDSSPTTARAKSRAVNGARSSTPSPTPMIMYRQTEFVGDGNENPAARRAVELGHHQAGNARYLAENLHLAERILADRRIEHEQHRVRRGRLDLAHDAHHLLQFAHQFGAVLQTAGRIDEHNLNALRLGRGDRIERKPGGIGARLARHHLRACAFAPDLQLIDRGRAEGIARHQHHAFSLRTKSRRKLADGRGFAGTIDAGHQNYERSRRSSRVASRPA